MSFISFIFYIYFLINLGDAIQCPSSYNSILKGCYKIMNGTNATWSNAQQYCNNEQYNNLTNNTDSVFHLLALESGSETTSLLYWMKAWAIQSEFWIDGVAVPSTWNWSNQSILWNFASQSLEIDGIGSHFQLIYNTTQNGYRIADRNHDVLSNFICEYQESCDSNHSCQNNATCYLNAGRDLCLCPPGYTGDICDQQIDECLSSPCQHGGICTDHLNNYTCNCSNLFFSGRNCEIENDDPTRSQRSAAFWSVFGVVCGLVVLLTLSDIPWHEIARTIGCPWYRLKCCSTSDDDDDDETNMNRIPSTDLKNNLLTSQVIVSNPSLSSRGMNYPVMNTVWNPDHLTTENIPIHPQYIPSPISSDQQTTPNNALIQSFAAVVLAKQKAKEIEDKRVYAVDIVETNDEPVKNKTAAETMVSWTQQLQEQLKQKSARPTSASSTKQLIQSEIDNENQ